MAINKSKVVITFAEQTFITHVKALDFVEKKMTAEALDKILNQTLKNLKLNQKHRDLIADQTIGSTNTKPRFR